MTFSYFDQKTNVLLKNFDFLHSLIKCSPQEAEKILKNATTEELKALLDCLALRTHLDTNPLTKKENILIQKACRRKRVKQFMQSKFKYIAPLVACVLVKIIQDLFIFIYDMS